MRIKYLFVFRSKQGIATIPESDNHKLKMYDKLSGLISNKRIRRVTKIPTCNIYMHLPLQLACLLPEHRKVKISITMNKDCMYITSLQRKKNESERK